MKMPVILAIETSCDETAAAVTQGDQILASEKWTQTEHAEWGGVVPSLAKRAHEEKIETIINQVLVGSKLPMSELDAVAVTVGPGLAIALEVGIRHAKEWAKKLNKPLIGVNHIEGHILSALVESGRGEGWESISFPCLGLVVSGGHTQLIFVEKAGKYNVLLESMDDNIGEALDKGARLLGLPYPGGAELERLARMGDAIKFKLPLPMAGKEGKAFSYSGLKTAFGRLISNIQHPISNQDRADLAATYQEMVFRHVVRTIRVKVQDPWLKVRDLLVGGGVIANKDLRFKIQELGHEFGWRVHFPANMMLCTDNAAMIGVVAGYKYERGEFAAEKDLDRRPKWKVGQS